MEESFEPADSDASSFHVYHFMPALRAYSASPALLPASGLTCLELIPLATFIFTWFRSIDITQGFQTAQFDQSILGCRLRYLVALLQRHQVQLLWASNAKAMTYVWFKHLQSLLYLFQRLATDAMWKTDSGFLPPAPDHPQVCPFNQDGQHFVDLVQSWDADLLAQWHRDRLHTSAAFYSANTIPASHFVKPPKERAARQPTQPGATGSTPPLSGSRRPAPDPEPDFRSVKPLFQLVRPPLTARLILDQFHAASPQGSRKPVLRHADGKSSLLCFLSSAAAPFNVCNTAGCFRNQQSRTRTRRNHNQSNANGPTPFSHVDFNDPYWATQPEAFWSPVVEWLRLPGVSASVLPSEFLRARTPSTPW